jgi:purine nucleosidase
VRKVVVDTDTGVDDALALLVLLQDRDTDLAAITSAAGNCSAWQAARNAAAVCAVVGRSSVPVHVGVEPAGKSYAGSPHGPDGLGGTGFGDGTFSLSPGSAPEAIIENARPDTELLCLAPLTNVAEALRRDPLVLSRYRRVVVMGGMGPRARTEEVLAVYPQFLSKGDTNTNHDPAATAAVAAAPGAVTWVGMNVTARLHVPYVLAERSTTTAGRFVAAITAVYARYATSTYASSELIFTAHDAIAATVSVDPEAVTASAGGIGEVRRGVDGRSALWAHGGDGAHQFATAVDYARVLARVRALFEGGGEND